MTPKLTFYSKGKMNFIRSLIAILFLSIAFQINAQTNIVNDGTYSYETVSNDPMAARIYTLSNGLKVYLSVNKNEPRIQTYIAIATGGKNDPHDAQGLSHYLEHMLFKGTDKFGTKDFAKEKPLIDEIIALYEERRKTDDPEERKQIYHKIDSVSYIASQFAIANEYDKMINSIGGSGSNAHTSMEETVYEADIPSNQLDKWLTIEAERFRNPVMRLFHTELEAVYEEKNRSLDNDNSKVYEAMMSGLFQKHTYGTQTTIGSVDQLKNPSIQTIIDYYNEKYVPNNMAICLAGDLDFDKTIRLIDAKFGSMQNKTVPPFIPPVEDNITSPIVKDVYGPSPEYVMFGYRAPGAETREAEILVVLEYILSNGSAGLIDLNLNQDQKVIGAGASTIINKDYSVIFFRGMPREGQSLDDVKNLLMSQIELLKKGDFPDWLIPAIVDNFKLGELQSLESNSYRADEFVTSFILGIPWEKYISYNDRLSTITKQDVVDYANKNLKDNYVIVYKKTGEDPTIQKVEKPEISPVNVNREDESEFVETVLSEKTEDIKPVFVDYKKEISELKIKDNIPLYYLNNNKNDLYNMTYIVDLGTNQNKKLNLAIDYLDYLGTNEYTASQLKQEFYKLASSYSINVGEDRVTVGLSGLSGNFEKASELLEKLMWSPVANQEALNNLVDDIIKQRADAKLNKRTILFSAMVNYAKYGKDNPFTYRLSEEELRNTKPDELISIIKDIFSYKQRVLYFGPETADEIISAVNIIHNVPTELKTMTAKNKFVEKDMDETQVYVVNYDMQQAEILMMSKAGSFNKEDLPIISLYNEYFGGSMGSIVFQELRESKALAYSASSSYQVTGDKEKPNYVVAYIGSQADKLPEAMAGMTELLKNIPRAENLFAGSKNSLIKQIQSQRVNNSEILSRYEGLKKLGIDYDIRKEIYEKIQNYTLDDVINFQKKNVMDRKYSILVLGDIKKLDMTTLEKYGKVTILSLKDVFGY